MHSAMHSVMATKLHAGMHSAMHSVMATKLHAGMHTAMHSGMHSGMHPAMATKLTVSEYRVLRVVQSDLCSQHHESASSGTV